MSSEYIPFEIQAEILKWLPVKPLIQFRSVSKSYKRLIDSPDFIVSYGIHRSPDDRFFLSYDDIFGKDKYISLVDNYDSFVQQEFVPTVPEFRRLYFLLGSSHGLLCFKGYYENMVLLWNPSIRKSVSIQVPVIREENFDSKQFNYVIGFGVCPVTFDPTILKIQYIDFGRNVKDMSGISVPCRVRVFTLSTTTWSILSTKLPRQSIRLRRSQVVIDRFIYWIAYDYMLDAEDGPLPSHSLLMSFDLTAKEFKEINLPDSLSNQLFSETLSKLRESLALFEFHRESGEDISVCCLWMMKEQGVSRSFTKIYNINLLPDVTINRILGFRKTGQIIMEMQQQSAPNADVRVYDPNSKAFDNLGIDGDSDTFSMCSYMETLLLHDHLDGFTYLFSN